MNPVDASIAAMAPATQPLAQALRAAILATSPTITEGIKWNAPSFRTTEWFATFNVRGKPGVRLILHLGAKAREGEGITIPDPSGLLQWLGKDRAMVSFTSEAELADRGEALTAVLLAWLPHV
jgi:hypothetical protein